MAPKKTPQPKNAALISKIKASLDRQKQFEEEQLRLIEEERKKMIEDERLIKEQLRIDELEKEKKIEFEKENKKKIKEECEYNKKIEIIERLNRGYNNSQNGTMSDSLNGSLNESQSDFQNNIINGSQSDFQNNTINGSRSDTYRAPISCVIGHVDAGKTTLLDYIRNTNVQLKEERGITQLLGATFLPNANMGFDNKFDGILFLDTPGHEQFVSMRNRGTSICDIAILVVNITSGLEKQTIDSIRSLVSQKCPFVVALNKIDKLYDWSSSDDTTLDIHTLIQSQKDYVISEYNMRCNQILLELAECGINAKMYYDNLEMNKYVSIVPISAITGAGINNLLKLMLHLVEKYMKKNMLKTNLELNCVIMEMTLVTGFGITLDIILVNGILKKGDKIVLCGTDGNVIITKIKKLLIVTPNGGYLEKNSIHGSMCIKIVADNLDNVMLGSRLNVINDGDNETEICNDIISDYKGMLSKIVKDSTGVIVQCSTLGTMESLLNCLCNDDLKVPICSMNIGTVHKKHLAGILKEKGEKYSVLLALGVDITDDALEMANKNGIKIISSKIIYELLDKFKIHIKEYTAMLKEKNSKIAIFPVKLEILQGIRCESKDKTMILGCKVIDGQLRIGTKLIYKQLKVGTVICMQKNKINISNSVAKIGDELAIELNGQCDVVMGRHIDVKTIINSEISRESINALKESFRDCMTENDWKLIIELKKEQKIN